MDLQAKPLSERSHDLHELRSELESLRAERDRLLERQSSIAQLLKSPSPDKILHDLRNVLNELQLYKLLADPKDK